MPDWLNKTPDLSDAAPNTFGDQLTTSVSSSLITASMSVAMDADCYNMNHKYRGKCVVFNHEYFDTGFDDRAGSSVDAKRIQQTFQNLGFEVEILDNLVHAEVIEKINKLSEDDHGDSDCLCIFVLTHGIANDMIFAKDVAYMADKIWKPFTADKCKTLAGKPKLFFFQVTVVVFSVIIFAILGELYTERGSMLSTAIFMYAATSPINGYAGGGLYARMGGRVWIKQMLLSAFLLPALVCGTAFFINFIAIYYNASRAIPFGSMVAVTCICIFVILPLTLVGTILGRNLAGTPDAPCRVTAVPRPIPEKKWFMEPLIIIMLGGILPFGSIFIEMYFIFTSFWAYKIYYVYGFMLLVFIILMIVTVCVTIVCTYFLLNAEDYRWQWTSFLAAASTAGYVYVYSFYYFFFKTKMYGLFQTAFYFGYISLFSIALGIMCGTVGYIGTNAFVRKIYSTVKID